MENAMTQHMPSTRTRGVSQWLALVIGAVYLLVGVLGFFVTGFEGFAEHDHERTLLSFAINPLHNIVHLLIGLVGLALWSTPGRARTFGWLLAIGYGAAAGHAANAWPGVSGSVRVRRRGATRTARGCR